MVEEQAKGLEQHLDSEEILEVYRERKQDYLAAASTLGGGISNIYFAADKYFSFLEIGNDQRMLAMAIGITTILAGFYLFKNNSEKAYRNAHIDYLANGKFTKYKPKE